MLSETFSMLSKVDIFFLIIVGIAAIIITIIIIHNKIEKNRRIALRDLAMRIGFQYSKKTGKLPHHLELFNKGHSKKAYNEIKGKRSHMNIRLFDYRYVTGHGKHSQTHNQTIAMIHIEKNIPEFTLAREHFFHKIGKIVGMKDINFDSHPLFSDKYRLKGKNLIAVKKLFRPSILSYLESKEPNFVLEGTGDIILYYKQNKRISVPKIEEFLSNALAAARLFKKD